MRRLTAWNQSRLDDTQDVVVSIFIANLIYIESSPKNRHPQKLVISLTYHQYYEFKPLFAIFPYLVLAHSSLNSKQFSTG